MTMVIPHQPISCFEDNIEFTFALKAWRKERQHKVGGGGGGKCARNDVAYLLDTNSWGRAGCQPREMSLRV